MMKNITDQKDEIEALIQQEEREKQEIEIQMNALT